MFYTVIIFLYYIIILHLTPLQLLKTVTSVNGTNRWYQQWYWCQMGRMGNPPFKPESWLVFLTRPLLKGEVVENSSFLACHKTIDTLVPDIWYHLAPALHTTTPWYHWYQLSGTKFFLMIIPFYYYHI